MRSRSILSRILAMLAATVMVVTGLAIPAHFAAADTKAYEFTGKWIDAPESAVSNETVVGSEWKFDINDDSASPSNDPVANNVITVELENAQFTTMPSSCLRESPDAAGNEVTPLSSLSEDKRTLVCNIGTRNQGTAEISFAGVIADGPAGSMVGATGTFRDHTVELPKIPITNKFAMDTKFDGGAPQSYTGEPSDQQFYSFPFSVSHAKNTPAGPSTLTYELDLQISGYIGAKPEVKVRGVGCVPNDRKQSGHPYSAPGHPADQTTDFPECTIEKTGDTTFTLTLSNLDYSQSTPDKDSNNQPLPTKMGVIAAGEILFQSSYVTFSNSGQLVLKATEPEYTAVDGQTSTGNPDNNSNRVPVVRGGWTGGWVVGNQHPEAYPGSPWTDTSRAPAGATVMAVGAAKIPHLWNQRSDNWICKVLDTEYVEFEKVRLALNGEAEPNLYYDESYTGDFWYYTGEIEDPNTFECGTTTDPTDPAHGNPPGWSTELPADLSTVKAVKVRIPKELGTETTAMGGRAYMIIEHKIKPETPIGQDIWTWTFALEEGRSSYAWTESSLRTFHRTDDTAHAPGYGKLTPDARYPYAAPGRDVLRVVGSQPLVEKEVAQNEYGPSQQADYTIRYGLESNMAQPAPDTVVIEDTLPAGLEYVAESASIGVEPSISTNDDGQSVLTWTFENVQPNEELQVLSFKAQIPDDAQPGSTHVNKVTATSQGIKREASAEFVIPNSGYTTVVKETKDQRVLLEDGKATNAWTLTLESKDPNTSAWTDVIDILPYNGDERGTDFTGSLKLTDVTVPEGTTVYYSTADPATLDEDPNHSSNGKAGEPSDAWTELSGAIADVENVTAIRVINNNRLTFGNSQEVTFQVAVDGASPDNTYVNTAVGRAQSTEMRMRTSDWFTVYVEEEEEEETTPPATPDPDPEETDTEEDPDPEESGPEESPTDKPSEPATEEPTPTESVTESSEPEVTETPADEKPEGGLANTGAVGLLTLVCIGAAALLLGAGLYTGYRRKKLS